MKGLSPAIAVMLIGAALATGSAIALATSPTVRGGHALAPKTRNAPPPPMIRQERGGHTNSVTITITHGGTPTLVGGSVGYRP